MATTTQVLTDYQGIPQEEAAKHLAGITRTIKSALTTIGNNSRKVGQLLNQVADTGLAVAAEADIADGTRDWSDDGNQTAVSRYVKLNFPTLTKSDVHRYRAEAKQFDALESAGVDTKGIAPSAFRSLPVDAPMGKFVEVVTEMLASETPKVTAAAFTAAAREVGIVPPSAGGGSVSAIQKYANSLMRELHKDKEWTAGERRTIKLLMELLADIA